jgi:hypothetical protein
VILRKLRLKFGTVVETIDQQFCARFQLPKEIAHVRKQSIKYNLGESVCVIRIVNKENDGNIQYYYRYVQQGRLHQRTSLIPYLIIDNVNLSFFLSFLIVLFYLAVSKVFYL